MFIIAFHHWVVYLPIFQSDSYSSSVSSSRPLGGRMAVISPAMFNCLWTLRPLNRGPGQLQYSGPQTFMKRNNYPFNLVETQCFLMEFYEWSKSNVFNSTPSDEIILFSAMILGEILNLGMIDMTGWIEAGLNRTQRWAAVNSLFIHAIKSRLTRH